MQVAYAMVAIAGHFYLGKDYYRQCPCLQSLNGSNSVYMKRRTVKGTPIGFTVYTVTIQPHQAAEVFGDGLWSHC